MVRWNEQGLVPAVAQDAVSGAVLMVAWVNREALAQTLATGFAHFYSRSRQSLWKKGETSGHTLRVQDVLVDCDADTLLFRVSPAGPACHTGKPSCFYRRLSSPDQAGAEVAMTGSILDQLAQVLEQRRTDSTAERSYTKLLLQGGFAKILGKIAEEQQELADELESGTPDQVVHETADLLFHIMVGLTARQIPIADVLRELGRRFGTSGHEEKAARR
jgi:phosphoribosyl-AMP cyclohydrolase / phosphoribosyl-ATP pyrophosphohydrolase